MANGTRMMTYLVVDRKGQHRFDDNRCPQGDPSRLPSHLDHADDEDLPRASISLAATWRKVKDINIFSKAEDCCCCCCCCGGDEVEVLDED